jgi:hypothetical protein
LFFRQNVSPDLIKTDSMESKSSALDPHFIMEPIIDLRTPSFFYNHGGYYAPGDPKTCNTPGGPCSVCQARIDEEEAAEALLLLSKSCCTDRAPFMEPCPDCNKVALRVTHAAEGIQRCNGCEESLCTNCFGGARYFCPLRTKHAALKAPDQPLERQLTLGVQSPRAEEKTDNK